MIVRKGTTGTKQGVLPKRSTAAAMGRTGGMARARALTKGQRAMIAKKAAATRWAATRGS
jgi:hypothetical protein